MNKIAISYMSIFSIIILTNIIFSTYFIAIFLAGTVFMIFMECLKKEYYYMGSFGVFTFLVIENTHNLKFLSLTLISLFLYFFIIPKIKHLFSLSFFADTLYIVCFYLIFYVYYLYTNDFDISSYNIFLTNLIIDSIVIGLFL
jgi:hypothetical protein